MPKSNAKNSEAKQQIEETYEKAEEAAVEVIENVKEAVHETLEASSESVKNTSEKAGNIIKERPLLSVGCAFLAGWAVSKLIK